MTMRPIPALVLLTLAGGLAVAGCQPDVVCDPGQIANRGTCFDAVPDAAVPEDGGAYAAFGTPCEDPENPVECEEPTTLCVPIPGMTPFCSASGCLDDATICPPTWTCEDVSAFDPRAPTDGVCIPPL